MEVCQAERLCVKRFLVPAAACLPYQAALAKAYPLQFLNAGFVMCKYANKQYSSAPLEM
jgi:hypothetical protein